MRLNTVNICADALIGVLSGPDALIDRQETIAASGASAARAIGGLAAAADGQVDRVILTGGLAHSRYVAAYLTKKLSFIAPVEIMAGEFELEALAAGACRVLEGQERPKQFALPATQA